MFKQGPTSSPGSCPLGVKKLGVDMEEGEGSGFGKRKVVQGSRGFSTGGLSKSKPRHPEQGMQGGNGMRPAAQVLGFFAISVPALGLPCCHSFLHWDK